MSREAGKGDSLRPVSKPNYDKNWDKINWSKPSADTKTNVEAKK